MSRRGRPPKGALPPPDNIEHLLELWKRAYESPMGIAIESTYPNRLAQRLYATRREIGGFNDLKIIERETEVWIMKHEVP